MTRAHGTTSACVAANLRHIRTQRGLSSYELADRLKELGRTIHQTGIVRIETGQRRVDVDDLMALAVALGCSPNRLLLPAWPAGTDGGAMPTSGLPGIRARLPRIWAWACGERPLTEVSAVDAAVFRIENRPHQAAAQPAKRSTT